MKLGSRYEEKPHREQRQAAAPRTASLSHQMHSSPASSLCEQLFTPQSGFSQSKIEYSCPLQFTSSSQICPEPLKDELNKQTSKQTVGLKKEYVWFFSKETPVNSRCRLVCTAGLLEIKPLGTVQAAMDMQLPHPKGNELPLSGDLYSPAAHV